MFRRSRIDRAGLRAAAQLLHRATRVVVLTGAGFSTPSGIPDFRSVNTGLWSFTDPLEVASIWSFHAQPQRFYQWLQPLARSILTAQPNAAHYALTELARLGKMEAVITQNIDGLHQAAGASRVLELHGHVRTMVCLRCNFEDDAAVYLSAFLEKNALPTCSFCGAVLKPNTVLFGEPLPENELLRAQELALHCDAMIVAGSSLEVMPAADLPALAKRRGAKLIMINLSPTTYDHLADVLLRGDVAYVLPQLAQVVVQELDKERQHPDEQDAV